MKVRPLLVGRLAEVERLLFVEELPAAPPLGDLRGAVPAAFGMEVRPVGPEPLVRGGRAERERRPYVRRAAERARALSSELP